MKMKKEYVTCLVIALILAGLIYFWGRYTNEKQSSANLITKQGA
jgi:hypothetical protein